MAAAPCSHLDVVQITDLQGPLEGCEECLKSGGRWVHLRMCLTRAKVGCCDSSPSRHAAARFHESGDPLVRSAEPGEDWAWCYVDKIALVFGPG